MRRRLVRVLVGCVALAGAGAAAADDGIVLEVQGPKTQLTFSWTGGAPNFQVLRGDDPATASAIVNLRAVTSDFTYTETPIRPLPGQGLYYLVQETELEAGGFATKWIDGTACATEPPIQVHAYNDDLFILRQSLCTSFEGPFMYLLFGEDKVLMQDTGDGGIPIADTVYAIIDQWLFDHGKASIELIVSHSHAHGDHTAGDGQFAGQPLTTVVGWSPLAVANFFGITDWPEQIVEYDLGGRIIDIIPIPGHEPSHIALYDRRTGILFTGDTLYPGRLYIINSFQDYWDSVARLVGFIADKPVLWDLGTHIEMTKIPYEDFPFGATEHPNEHELPLHREHLIELLAGVEAMAADPFIEAHRDFIIWPF